MKNRTYWALVLTIVLLLSAYPLYMLLRVLEEWSVFGIVTQDNYPKYLIPYGPIALAVLSGTVLLALTGGKRLALPMAGLLGVGVFLIAELLLEDMLILVDSGPAYLSDWQMVMCYTQATVYHTLSAVEVLMGDYDPWFKLHFYLIALVLILSFLSCFHGFAEVVRTGKRGRMKALTIQAISTAAFLGLCIFACFTAFYRTGELTVRPVSAWLMGTFFVILGVSVGAGVTVLTPEKWRWLPPAASSAVTLLMYIGELILLDGHLYRFGDGLLFDGLGALVLAPVDVLVILLPALLTCWIGRFAGQSRANYDKSV